MENKKAELKKINSSGELELVEEKKGSGQSVLKYIFDSKNKFEHNMISRVLNQGLNSKFDSLFASKFIESPLIYSSIGGGLLSATWFENNKYGLINVIESFKRQAEIFDELAEKLDEKDLVIERTVFKFLPNVSKDYSVGIDQKEFVEEFLQNVDVHSYLSMTAEQIYLELCSYAKDILAEIEGIKMKHSESNISVISKAKKVKTIEKEENYRKYATNYCICLKNKKDKKEAKQAVVERYNISLRTLKRALDHECTKEILDTYKIEN